LTWWRWNGFKTVDLVEMARIKTVDLAEMERIKTVDLVENAFKTVDLFNVSNLRESRANRWNGWHNKMERIKTVDLAEMERF